MEAIRELRTEIRNPKSEIDPSRHPCKFFLGVSAVNISYELER
jgi:hypothetical protein